MVQVHLGPPDTWLAPECAHDNDSTILTSFRGMPLWSGDQTALRAGDTCVVTGGEHAWSNRTDQPVTLVTVGVAAAPD
ncbi:MAG: hypothetical protein PSX37_02910 [bacterium]|nr:hypothetical protein [bacterium]